MNQPECLHIPTLHEGKEAQTSWGLVENDKNYLLQRIFNQTFSHALSGYNWDNFDSTDAPWSQYDQAALNWNQIEIKTGKGQHWERLDYDRLNWSQIEKQSFTWHQTENREIDFEIFKGPGTEQPDIEKGCTWLELDELDKAWSSLEESIYSWKEGERITLPGITWESIDSRWLTFKEWETKDLTFQEYEKQKYIEEHRGMKDFIPIGASSAMYRIKSLDLEEESDYLITEPMPVIPIFYRNSKREYPVKSGNRYVVLLRAHEVTGLEKIRMNLRYNPYLLRLTNFAANGLNKITQPGNYPEEKIIIYSSTPGNTRFQSTRQLRENECFSGSIALVELVAIGNGNAELSLY